MARKKATRSKPAGNGNNTPRAPRARSSSATLEGAETVDIGEVQLVAHKSRNSRYDQIADEIAALKPGKVLLIPVEDVKNLDGEQIRMAASVRRRLGLMGHETRVRFSKTQDGRIAVVCPKE